MSGNGGPCRGLTGGRGSNVSKRKPSPGGWGTVGDNETSQAWFESSLGDNDASEEVSSSGAKKAEW